MNRRFGGVFYFSGSDNLTSNSRNAELVSLTSFAPMGRWLLRRFGTVYFSRSSGFSSQLLRFLLRCCHSCLPPVFLDARWAASHLPVTHSRMVVTSRILVPLLSECRCRRKQATRRIPNDHKRLTNALQANCFAVADL